MEIFFESFLIGRSDGSVDNACVAEQSSLARAGVNHGSAKLDGSQSRFNLEGASRYGTEGSCGTVRYRGQLWNVIYCIYYI
jgi:hypothetical protein